MTVQENTHILGYLNSVLDLLRMVSPFWEYAVKPAVCATNREWMYTAVLTSVVSHEKPWQPLQGI